MRVEVKSKVIPASFLKIEGRGTLVGAKGGRLVELLGHQNPGLKAPCKCKRRRERREQRRCQGRSDEEE